MDSKTFTGLALLVIGIIFVIYKKYVVNMFDHKHVDNGTVRTCKNCSTKHYKSNIVGKWCYVSTWRDRQDQNCKCKRFLD